MIIEEAFGIVIRRLRRERNLSQDKLSISSSLDRTFISNIEGGKQQPGLLTIFELAKALNVTVSRIMIEVECLLKFNGPEKLKPCDEKARIGWISDVEKFMTELSEAHKGDETLLVVDDENQLRDMLHAILTRCGYKVLLAEDGQDAIEKFKLHKDSIKLIIMDIVMPRKDGISTYKSIKEIDPKASMLLMSGYIPIHFNKSEEFTYLQKPFKPFEIIQKVRLLLDENNRAVTHL